MDDLFLQRAIEPLGDAVGLGHRRRRRRTAGCPRNLIWLVKPGPYRYWRAWLDPRFPQGQALPAGRAGRLGRAMDSGAQAPWRSFCRLLRDEAGATSAAPVGRRHLPARHTRRSNARSAVIDASPQQRQGPSGEQAERHRIAPHEVRIGMSDDLTVMVELLAAKTETGGSDGARAGSRRSVRSTSLAGNPDVCDYDLRSRVCADLAVCPRSSFQGDDLQVGFDRHQQPPGQSVAGLRSPATL